ncbi:PD-(D/E)XK nuclease family protein [Desulfovibrio sp. Huiquan2017]|uniref:PD-(D/E)XK nuclease family protein n=1 Tax=Desulfovibrio sp. Huiquan2017 TaxID=2816861 RepID=UPI001A912459|nr:PD-(D/E)XK nuclease family protein [Desulfovibrio sp. Huiquan2017]
MRPVILIPWQTDFMPVLADMVAASDDPGRLTVLFPHNRPRRHLKGLLAAHPSMKRPAFMPEMTSIADFVSGLHRRLAPTPPVRANPLDLMEMLHRIVLDLSGRKGRLLSRLPELDREAFLPWGMLLARLMDDLLRQDLAPQDLEYMEGEVSAYAAALLEQLRAIHHEYLARLDAKGWTTPGLSASFVLDHLDDVAHVLGGRTVLAAGFYALSGTEDRLFRFLWERELLTPVLHSDPALAEGGRAHWATAEHTAWLARWGVRPEIPQGLDTTPRAPNIRFCEGYDRHSQLAGLAEDMREVHERDTLDRTAVVLPDEGALLPVLHLLPEVDPELEPNISMGYPLARTSLARLIETLLTLQENRAQDGRYYWKDVIALIRHPYLRLLGPEDRPLRPVLHFWEATIRRGDKFLAPQSWEPDWEDDALKDVDRAVAGPLLTEILTRCLAGFESTSTLAELGEALAGLAGMLHAHGEKLWHTYLLDAECLFRLTNSIIPQLKGAETCFKPFGRSTLHAFLRRMLDLERVSFEPDPLTGLQVLGVLETRLLHFDKLFILDAVEERLPGTNPFDPLLPDPLRRLLALPDARERDNVSGYNFYRLLMGAREAVVYYQNGVQPGLLDQKSVRSRFVEQLLWERELAAGRLLTPEDGVVRTVTFPASSLPAGPPPIPATAAVRGALTEFLTAKGLSPSSLDAYLNCPKRFFYQYLSGVRPVDSVDEEGDRSEFGSLIHDVLKEFLLPHVGTGEDLAALDPEPLLNAFSETFRAGPLFARLPLDTRMALMEAGRYRLEQFVATQQPATLLGLEHPLETVLTQDGLDIPFKGRIDRVERREKGVFILDYKTGGAQMPKTRFWGDMELLDRMAGFLDGDVDPDLLTDLADAARSVQLPAYLHLYAEAAGESPVNAGLVLLGQNGKEQRLFPDKWTEEEVDEAVDEIAPLLVQTLVRHMLTAPRFGPRPGDRCKWCDFCKPCGQTPPKDK